MTKNDYKYAKFDKNIVATHRMLDIMINVSFFIPCSSYGITVKALVERRVYRLLGTNPIKEYTAMAEDH